jgi:hypothetical protein
VTVVTAVDGAAFADLFLARVETLGAQENAAPAPS